MGRSKYGEQQLVLVMITGDGPEHHYVVNRILEDFDLDAIIVDRGLRQTRAERIRYLTKKYTVAQLISRMTLRLTALLFRDASHRRRALLDVLGADSRRFANPTLVQYVDGINTADGRAAVSAASPDLLLIYGTGIVGSRVLALARTAALNLHTGMSPDYRGSDCVFWPILKREYRLVGATIHECTNRIDGGEIYRRQRAELQPDEGQFAAFARCVEVGAELYVSTIRRALSGPLEGEEQDLTTGREYRAADKKLGHDLSVRWAFRSGRLRRHLQAEPVAPLSTTGDSVNG